MGPRQTEHLHLECAHLARAVGDEAGYGRELRAAYDLFLAVGAPARAGEVASLMAAADLR